MRRFLRLFSLPPRLLALGLALPGLSSGQDLPGTEPGTAKAQRDLQDLRERRLETAKALQAEAAGNSLPKDPSQRDALLRLAAAQADQGETLGGKLEAAQPAKRTLPLNLRLPDDADAATRAALRERAAIVEDLEAVQKSGRTLPESERVAALKKWRETNATRIEKAGQALAAAMPAAGGASGRNNPPARPPALTRELAARDQLVADLQELQEQLRTLPPEERAARLRNWQDKFARQQPAPALPSSSGGQP